VASTMAGHNCPPDKKDRDFGEFSPSKIAGRRVADLFETEKSSGIIDTLRIASLNAISSRMIAEGHYNILENADPIDLIDLDGKKNITLVGAFKSYIAKIAATGNHLSVLELDEDALTGEQKQYYVPAREYGKVLPGSDIVIITGLTLVNNTIDGLLSAIAPGTLVIVTGPSSSLIPDVLFSHRVNIIGATQVTDPGMLFTVAGEAGAGYHLFRYCAKKICIINENKKTAKW